MLMPRYRRDWRDPRWTSARAVATGLTTSIREQRQVLMGENIIDIASKSAVGLLLDEVWFKRCHGRSTVDNEYRSCTPSTFFRSPRSSCGRSMTTTTTPSQSPSSA